LRLKNENFKKSDMNVEELINELQKYDPKAKVLVTSEQESILKEEDLIRVFGIIDIHKTMAELTRLDDGRPSLKYCHSRNAIEIVEIEITED
jgi:hypothetical protein